MERITKLESYGKEFWHNVLPLGEFYDPRYGKVKVTKELIKQIAENFHKGYPHYKPPVNISHEDANGKYGDVVDVEAREDGLWVKIALSKEGTELVETKKFEYLSAEYTEHYTDKETGKDVGAVLLGVALTNRPAHPEVKPIKLSERIKEFLDEVVQRLAELFRMQSTTDIKLMIPEVVNTPKDDNPRWDWDWVKDANEIIDKMGWKGLAKACAYVDVKNYPIDPSDGLPHNKQAYKLPHHKLINGRLTLVWGGTKAAMAALLGARGGVDIPREDKPKVYKHLAEHYKAFEKEPPEFHFKEVETVELEEKLVKLEEEKKELEAKIKKLEEENKQLKQKILEAEIEQWAKEWISKGIKPATVEKAKSIVLSDPSRKKDFEELFKTIADPNLFKQLGEKSTDPLEQQIEKAKKVAKSVWGGEEK